MPQNHKLEIHENIEIVDLALKYKDYLIISDLQLGYEENLMKSGVLLPRFQVKDAIERLEKILKKANVKNIIINGDIKHEFGEISNQEWRDTLKLFDFLSEKVNNIILIKGNHDIVLGPIASKRKIKVVDYFEIDDILITHGHKILPNVSKVIIIGHEHPAISFNERRDEKFKCFLKGKWNKHVLIVTPSFNLLVEGHDITREGILSPYLQDGLKDFEVFVVEEEVFPFGKLKDI